MPPRKSSTWDKQEPEPAPKPKGFRREIKPLERIVPMKIPEIESAWDHIQRLKKEEELKAQKKKEELKTQKKKEPEIIEIPSTSTDESERSEGEYEVKEIDDMEFIEDLPKILEIPEDEDEIPDMRFGGWHFHVKWSNGDETLEPLINLKNAHGAIAQFFKKQLEMKNFEDVNAHLKKVVSITGTEEVDGRICFNCKWDDGTTSTEPLETLYTAHIHVLYLWMKKMDRLKGKVSNEIPKLIPPPIQPNSRGLIPQFITEMKFVGESETMRSNKARFLVHWDDKSVSWEPLNELGTYQHVLVEFFNRE